MADPKLPRRRYTSKMVLLIFGTPFCVGMWALTFAGLCADSQAHICGRFPCDQYSARDETAMIAGFSMLPFAWVSSPFTTGFYQRGFRWGVSASKPIPEGQKQ